MNNGKLISRNFIQHRYNSLSLEVVENFLIDSSIEIAEPNTFGEFVTNANDTYYWDQWHLQDEIITGGIDAYKAWNKENGDPDVVIGILDSGTDILHEDLEGNIWVNPGEDLDHDGVVWDADDMNGVDDDGNGLVDDLSGWDFENNNNYLPGPYYHGTHVAGIAGAETNNQQGVAGVAGGWTTSDKGCSLLIGAVGGNSPVGSVLDDAILYAAKSGANVITMSLTVGYSQAIVDAINTAYNTYGVFVDCASGNQSSSSLPFPANAENCFSVGASTQRPNPGEPFYRADFSNYGIGLMLVAPGVGIESTQLNNTYGAATGTSFSAPQVAATAGLIHSYHPYFNLKEIEKVLCLTAMKLPNYVFTDGYEYGTWNNEVGYGKLNADRAIGIKDDIASNMILKEGNYICDEVHLTNNSTLSLTGNSRLYLLRTANLIVDAGSTMIIDDYASISGNLSNKVIINGNLQVNGQNVKFDFCGIDVNSNGTLTINSGKSIQLASGSNITIFSSGNFGIGDNSIILASDRSQLIINGNIVIGQGVTFDKTPDAGYFGGLILNNQIATVTLDDVSFHNSQLINYCQAINIVNSDIGYTYFGSHRGNVTLDNSTFAHAWTYFTNSGSLQPLSTLTITNCNFSYGNYAGINMEYYDKFNIENNQIFNCTGGGISIYNSGRGPSGNQNISFNEIYNNSSSGISLYNTTASVAGNNIHNNQFGVKFFNNSRVAFFGNPTTYDEMNLVMDNTSYEFYASGYSFPWYFRYNAIIDEDNLGNPTDPMVYYQVSGGEQIPKDIRYNC